MGIFKAASSSVKGTMADQWKDYFVCDSLPADTLLVRGSRANVEANVAAGGNRDIISDGSIICVADGQAAILINGGKVTGVFTEPGENVIEHGASPSIWTKGGAGRVAEDAWERFTFGGTAPHASQRVYYVNTKEMPGNTFAPESIPFAVDMGVDGSVMDCTLICGGMFSYRITDPAKVYKKLAGNVSGRYTSETLLRQMNAEMTTYLQTGLAKKVFTPVRPGTVGSFMEEVIEYIRTSINEFLKETRGVEIVSLAFEEFRISTKDLQMLQRLQHDKVLTDPGMAGAYLLGAYSDALKDAAQNPGGAMPAMMAVSMVKWICSCNARNTGNFCTECGGPKQESHWECECGTENTGKFCTECGKPGLSR